ILSMASHSEKVSRLCLYVGEEPHLSDPAAFIDKLCSLPVKIVDLYCPAGPRFFGLPNHFWKNYFDEKLSNGAVKWMRHNKSSKIFSKAPIDWPDNVYTVVWE
ncbi:hypothetical protein PMAYCL1PPCAC_13825, partial [Pristionchus mayeri]